MGACAGCSNTTGDNNIAIGCMAQLASATGDCQFIIGMGSNKWICGDSSFNIYDKDGNQLNGAGGGGLSNFTESESTSSPNNTVAANRLIATGSGSNIDAVFQPKGTGAFLAQLPDSATAGGNKRGCYAVDLQMIRPNAACVSCGIYASIAGGCGNKAGDCGFVGGGVLNSASYWGSVTGGCSNTANSNWAHVGGGHANSASYAAVVAGGQNNSANGTYASVLGGSSNVASGYGAVNISSGGSSAQAARSTAMGYYACTYSRAGSISMAANCTSFSGKGKVQETIMQLAVQTADATATVATTNTSSAGIVNQLTLPANSAMVFTGTVVANVTSGGNTHAWQFRGSIKRGSTNVALVGTPSIDDIAYDSGASAWSFAISADTSNQALAFTVTGQASTTIRWVVNIHATEVAF